VQVVEAVPVVEMRIVTSPLPSPVSFPPDVSVVPLSVKEVLLSLTAAKATTDIAKIRAMAVRGVERRFIIFFIGSFRTVGYDLSRTLLKAPDIDLGK
jgi:hypothetical protein